MADALLLASQRVRPGALEGAGYEFEKPDLAGAFRAAVGS
jgi:NAD dependent epimerase/dehydratase family enzyme